MGRLVVWVVLAVLVSAGRMAPAAASGMDDGRAFVTAGVVRYSQRTDRFGLHLPPWDRVEIWGLEFKDEPAIGAPVTVVPFAAGILPVTLTVAAAAAGETCAEEEPPWLITLSPVTRADFYDAVPVTKERAAAYPFDVAVIYPAAEDAAYVAPADIDPTDIPDGFGRIHIRGAVDLDHDRHADVLFVNFCTKAHERDQPYTRCDYVSSRTYLRAAGDWLVVAETQPC